MKKELATLIVEKEFHKIYCELLEGYKSSQYKALLKMKFMFNRIIKLTMLLTSFISIFILFFSILDIIYGQNSYGKQLALLLLLLGYILVACLILASSFVLPMSILSISPEKIPSGKYKFHGLDKYLINKSKIVQNIDEIFSLNSKKKISVKIHKGVQNSIGALSKKRSFDIIGSLIMYMIPTTIIAYLINKLNFIDNNIATLIFNLFLGLSVFVLIISITFILMMYIRRRKVFMEYRDKNFNYNYFEVMDPDYSNVLLNKNNMFLEKVYLMRHILSNSSKNIFIDESNFMDYLGELAEAILHELVAFNSQNEYYLSNEKFVMNDFLKEGLNTCISNLSVLDIETLKKLSNSSCEELYMLDKDKILNETLNSYNTFLVGGVDKRENIIAKRGASLSYGVDNKYRNVYIDNRVKCINNKSFISKKIQFLNKIDFVLNFFTAKFMHSNDLSCKSNYNRYFQPYIESNRAYGFVGYDSSYLVTSFKSKRTFNSSNMYKSYQFILSGENSLEKHNEYYISKTQLKNQMFYNNKLILSAEVANILKDYLELDQIEVRYKERSAVYYLCEPKIYSSDVINEEMSLYLEKIGNKLVKDSYLVEPCIIKDKAKNLKLFGLCSKNITEYEYVKDFKYSYVIFTEEILKKLENYDDLLIIKNVRGEGKEDKKEKSFLTSLKSKEITLDYLSKYFKSLNNKKYSYSKEDILTYTKYNFRLVLASVLYVLIMILFIYYANNLPTDLFANLQGVQASYVRIFRLLYLVLPYLIIAIYFNIRKIIISPTNVIKNDELIHTIRALPIIGNRIRQKHKILDDDLSMAFHKNKVMFELPIENKAGYIDAELYYNGTSYALNGVEVDMEKAIQDGEKFVHELHYAFYLSNLEWNKLKQK